MFEDGAHTPGFTRSVLERLSPSLAPDAVVLCHDYYQRQFGPHVAADFAAALPDAHGVLVGASDCGLGYARIQPLAVAAAA